MAGVRFVVRLISAELIGQYSSLVGDSVAWLSWLVVVSSLGARIVETAKDLYGRMLPFDVPSNPNDLTQG